jgi:energy-coupling factor transporter transmembrane protein EcfT
MQTAFRARAGRSGMRAALASSGMVAGLFMRSQERAERIYHAMLSRGYTGQPQLAQPLTARPLDYLLLVLGLLVLGSTLVL